MDKKIELIEQDGNWGWYCMRWDSTNKGWYTAHTGVEPTIEQAAAEAKKAYGWMA